MTLPVSISANSVVDLVPAASFDKSVGTPAPAMPEVPPACDVLDRAVTAEIARFTGGLSPAALALAFADWAVHLAAAPGRQLSLAGEIMQDVSRLTDTSLHWATTFQPWSLIRPPPQDHRFVDPDWSLADFNLVAQAFLLGEKWWHAATTNVHGVSRSNAAIVDFTLRQYLDTVAP